MTARIPARPIVALSIAGCGSAAALRVCDPLLPYFAREHGVGLAAAAHTVTAFAIAYGLFQLARAGLRGRLRWVPSDHPPPAVGPGAASRPTLPRE